MFWTKAALAEEYDYFSDKFKLAYEFLRRSDLAELPEGAIPLGQGVIANVQHYTTKPASDLKFETHDKYFDVQYVVRGSEIFGLTDRDGLEADGCYDEGNDIAFYKEPAYKSFY